MYYFFYHSTNISYRDPYGVENPRGTFGARIPPPLRGGVVVVKNGRVVRDDTSKTSLVNNVVSARNKICFQTADLRPPVRPIGAPVS